MDFRDTDVPKSALFHVLDGLHSAAMDWSLQIVFVTSFVGLPSMEVSGIAFRQKRYSAMIKLLRLCFFGRKYFSCATHGAAFELTRYYRIGIPAGHENSMAEHH